MAVDLRALRTAAARERAGDRAGARGRHAAALRSGRGGARARRARRPDLRRAERKIAVGRRQADQRPGPHPRPDRPGDARRGARRARARRADRAAARPARDAACSSASGGWDLGVRVFPDAIHGDAHERELTQEEQDAGAAFWARPAGERGPSPGGAGGAARRPARGVGRRGDHAAATTARPPRRALHAAGVDAGAARPLPVLRDRRRRRAARRRGRARAQPARDGPGPAPAPRTPTTAPTRACAG